MPPDNFVQRREKFFWFAVCGNRDLFLLALSFNPPLELVGDAPKARATPPPVGELLDRIVLSTGEMPSISNCTKVQNGDAKMLDKSCGGRVLFRLRYGAVIR